MGWGEPFGQWPEHARVRNLEVEVARLQAEVDRRAAEQLEAVEAWELMKAPQHPHTAVPFMALDQIMRRWAAAHERTDRLGSHQEAPRT